MTRHRPFFSLITLCILALSLLANGCSDSSAKKLKLGDRAPDFSAVGLDGSQIRLADFKGGPIVLRFFLTDCPYCKADTPIFIDILNKYQERGLNMVYINTNAANVSEVQTFVDDLAIPFPVIHDQAGAIATQYQIKTQPFALIISPEQKITGALLGGVSAEELEEMLAPFFQK